MAKSTHRFRIVEARSIKHPVLSPIVKHYFLVCAKDMPENMRADANAREPSGLNGRVYRDVQDSLLGENSTPGTFDLMNKGITVLAEAVRKIDDNTYDVIIDDGQGIVDGGHTYKIICETRKERNLPDEQFVEVQIRTGVDDWLVTDIAKGLNTGIQVKLHSLANLDGAFEWLKAEIESEPYFKLISWREGEKADYDVRDLICVLEAFNVFDFPNDKSKHPIHAYEKWSVAMEKFAKDYRDNKGQLESSTYYRLKGLLSGALELFDHIRRDFRDIHNQAGGNAGNLKIIEQAGRKEYEFPFAKLKPSNFRLTKGALFPILAAFRNAVEIDSRNRRARWVGGFGSVLKLWQEAGPELVQETFNATRDIGRMPDQIGKSRGHWANLHKTLELRMLRKKFSDRRSG
jgi:AIPR protein